MNRRAFDPAIARRGQPLAMLALLLAAWVGARAMLWEPLAALGPALRAALPVAARPLAAVVPVTRAAATENLFVRHPPLAIAAAFPGWTATPPPTPTVTGVPLQPAETGAVGLAAGRQILWMAGVALIPLPRFAAVTVLPPAVELHAAPAQSWSGDGWLLYRPGGIGAAGAGGLLPPTYGASQAGAMLRYRLAPGDARRPMLYLRASAALVRGGEREAALGFSARPLPRVPVTALAEARLTSSGGAIRFRPAVALISEFPPLDLPGGVSAEAYGQAGWIGGKDSTGFADGQLRATRTVLDRHPLRLALGGGAWGGAQKGASRLDLGPTATLALPFGRGGARLAADWRFRIAGNAAPGSGAAVTISAGF